MKVCLLYSIWIELVLGKDSMLYEMHFFLFAFFKYFNNYFIFYSCYCCSLYHGTYQDLQILIAHINTSFTVFLSAEAAVILWKKQQESSSDIFADDSEKENKEHWTVLKMLRGHLEDVYDLSWSKCSQFLISGSVDNSAILWDVGKGNETSGLNVFFCIYYTQKRIFSFSFFLSFFTYLFSRKWTGDKH